MVRLFYVAVKGFDLLPLGLLHCESRLQGGA